MHITMRTRVKKKIALNTMLLKRIFLRRSNLPPFWHTIRVSLHTDASRKQKGSDVY